MMKLILSTFAAGVAANVKMTNVQKLNLEQTTEGVKQAFEKGAKKVDIPVFKEFFGKEHELENFVDGLDAGLEITECDSVSGECIEVTKENWEQNGENVKEAVKAIEEEIIAQSEAQEE